MESIFSENINTKIINIFFNTESVEKEFCFGKTKFTEKIAKYPKIISALKIFSAVDADENIKLTYPEGKSGLFSLRIDADEIDEANFSEYLKILRPFKDWITVFCCVGSFIGKENVLRECIEVGFDIQSHGFYHYVYNDYENNYHNLSKANKFFEQFGIKPKGFAAPMGKYNSSLMLALENTGFNYSSDFSFDYLNLPLYPKIDGRFSRVLEVPVFPVCPEILFAKNLSIGEITQYFDCVINELKKANTPVIIYAHTNKHYPEVKAFLKQLLEKIKSDDTLYKCNLTKFSEWCLKIKDENFCRDYGLLNPLFYSGFLKPPDEKLLGRVTKRSFLKRVKNYIKDKLDFEVITPAEELKGSNIKNKIKFLLRNLFVCNMRV